MGVRSEQRWVRRCIEQHREVSDAARQAEALGMQRAPRKPVITPPPLPTRREVKRWMLLNADCDDVSTTLAESAAAALDLPEAWLDDETHWLWDVALEAWEAVQ